MAVAVPPLDDQTVDLFLSNMSQDMVLVGGQALAFWMSRFGIEPDGVAVSNDGDVLGKAGQALELAQSISARVELPEKTSLISIVAQLRLPTTLGKERNIDVLHMLYTVAGPRKSSTFTKRVIDDSVEVEWRPGKCIHVMDPFDVLESRAHNAVGLLKQRGPHVLTQAAWAIQVARIALLRIAADSPSGTRVGAKVQRLYKLSRSQVGRRLLSEHSIELLDAIDLVELRRIAPAHARLYDLIEQTKLERRADMRGDST